MRITLLLTAIITSLVFTASAGAKDLTVMSRNLYLGADLLPLAVYGSDKANLPQFEVAAGGVWGNVEKTAFPTRAKALARELKKTKPDVVGLQEAAIWRRSQTSGGETNKVVYDFIKTLISEARKQGLHYRLAVSQDEFDFTAPTNLGYSIRFTQRDALLVRKGSPLKVKKTMKRQYNQSFKVETPVGIADSKRGWVALYGKYGNRNLRIINTHLEAYGDDIRASQAQELLAGPVDTSTPLILTGDMNSSPQDGSGSAYQLLLGGGLSNVFTTPPLTCCQSELVNNPTSTLSQSIDHIMVKNSKSLKVHRRGVVGNKTADRISGLWPSDHAGVWARFKIRK